jgi:hypothetical protein
MQIVVLLYLLLVERNKMATKMMKKDDMKKEKMLKGKPAIAIMIGVGKPKKMATGGMPMVEKGGMKVPAFAADGKGKMAKGGAVKAPMAKKK